MAVVINEFEAVSEPGQEKKGDAAAEGASKKLEAAERDRYFAPRRLAQLRLPGAPAESALRRALRPAGGVGAAEEWRLTALGAGRRLARTWRVLRGR